MPVPNSFANVTTSIPLSQLDANFNTPITLGNTAIQLGNTVTTLNNMTLANVTISSGNVTITNVSVTTANVATANVTTSQILNYGTANSVQYLNTSKALTSDANFAYTATGLGIGTSSPAEKLDVVGTYIQAADTRTNNTNKLFGLRMPHYANATAAVNLIGAVSTSGGNALYIGGNDTSFAGTAATSILFYTAATGSVASGTQRMALDSSGNLGLGVTPSAWGSGRRALQVFGSSTAVYFAGATSNTYFSNNYYFDGTNEKFVGTGAYALNYVQQYDGKHIWQTSTVTAPSANANATISSLMTLDASGLLAIGRTSAWDSNALLTLEKSGVAAQVINSTTNTVTLVNVANGSSSVAYSGTTSNHPYYFITNNTERVRIDTSGNLLMGTTSLPRGATVNNLQVQSSSQGQIVMRNSGQAAGRYWFMGVESSNDVFIIYPDTSGGVYMTRGATSWTGNSDERLKTDLKPIENAAEKITQLRTVTGRFKTDEENVSRAFLIAQDVQAVLPEAVDTKDDEDGTLGIRYTDTIPLLVAAIKEQQAMIQELKAEIAALKGNA